MELPLRPLLAPLVRAQIRRGSGALLWDTAGKTYLDFHAAFATLNHGHCHPELVRALGEQAETLTLTSQLIGHDQHAPFAEKITKLFGYECVVAMNTGTEAVETALKYARRWGYTRKKIAEGQALVVVPEGTYSGSSFAAISASNDAELRSGFGPFLPGFVSVPYGNSEALAEALANPNVAALLLEPIQGESGVIIPPIGYLKRAAELCAQNNALFIADEIQTGLGRTGRMTACSAEGVRPDLLVLGKALSGGMFPISAVLCDRAVGDLVKSDEHHSTFAASPLACHVAVAALDVLVDEELAPRAEKLGKILREEINKFSWAQETRGRGLLNALELAADFPIPIWAVTRALEEEGVIALPLTKRALRLSPPLVISESELGAGLEKISRAFTKLSTH